MKRTPTRAARSNGLSVDKAPGSVLQCVAVWCSVSQCCNVLQCVEVRCAKQICTMSIGTNNKKESLHDAEMAVSEMH